MRFMKKIPGARFIASRLGLSRTVEDDRAFLLRLLPVGSVGAEIGVHEGSFSARLLNVVRPAKLHLIDPWLHQTGDRFEHAWYGGRAKAGQEELDDRFRMVQEKFVQEITSGTIQLHRGFSSDMLAKLEDGSLDWVYIDGNHLYEYVKSDLEMSFVKVTKSGLICGDDYAEGGWWDGGVKKAVDEFSRRDDVDIITIRNRQFVFRKL